MADPRCWDSEALVQRMVTAMEAAAEYETMKRAVPEMRYERISNWEDIALEALRVMMSDENGRRRHDPDCLKVMTEGAIWCTCGVEKAEPEA